jgi:hypothetical protein
MNRDAAVDDNVILCRSLGLASDKLGVGRRFNVASSKLLSLGRLRTSGDTTRSNLSGEMLLFELTSGNPIPLGPLRAGVNTVRATSSPRGSIATGPRFSTSGEAATPTVSKSATKRVRKSMLVKSCNVLFLKKDCRRRLGSG